MHYSPTSRKKLIQTDVAGISAGTRNITNPLDSSPPISPGVLKGIPSAYGVTIIAF